MRRRRIADNPERDAGFEYRTSMATVPEYQISLSFVARPIFSSFPSECGRITVLRQGEVSGR